MVSKETHSDGSDLTWQCLSPADYNGNLDNVSVKKSQQMVMEKQPRQE
jgi:hypothetical protein